MPSGVTDLSPYLILSNNMLQERKVSGVPPADSDLAINKFVILLNTLVKISMEIDNLPKTSPA